MKKWLIKNQKILWILLLWLVLFLFGRFSLDPDFGWHLRMGKIIVSEGIPKNDPFSYSMPSFPFIDHEWLFNVIIYLIHNSVGYTGLAMIFATLTTMTVFLISPKFKNPYLKVWEKIILVWIILIIVPFYGIRTQIISWFFTAILIKLFQNDDYFKKYCFWIPLLMIFWSNLHGSFPVGLVILSLIIFEKIITRKIKIVEIGIFLMSILATFINPYKLRLWQEIFNQISDFNLKWRISEWKPSFLSYQVYFFFLATLTIMLIYFYRKKISLKNLIIFGFFLIQAISSQRHIPLWVIVSMPIISLTFDFFAKEISSIKGSIIKLKTVGEITLKVILIILLFETVTSRLPFFKKTNDFKYPSIEAINFIKNKNYKGEIFSPYNWGGYLISNLEEKKVFIDGRMPSWRRKEIIFNESNDAMKDWLSAQTSVEGFNNVFNKYQIEAVFWQIPKEKNYQNKKIGKFNFIEELENKGWTKVYDDGLAIVYEKKKVGVE